MTSFAFDSLVTAPQTLIGDELGFIGRDGALVVNGGAAVTASETSDLIVLGALVSSGSGDAAYSFSGITTTVLIGPDGYAASTLASAISASVSQRAFINNSGVIDSGFRGVQVFASETGANITVQNSGEIRSGVTGVSYFGVYVSHGDGSADIVNTGLISAAASAVRIANNATGAVEFINDGTVISYGGNLSFNNPSAAQDRVVNRGTMEGDVGLGAGADFYDGRLGVLTGSVNGGGGNDTVLGSAVADFALGQEGDDVLRGFAGHDSLDGGLDNDRVEGGLGDDTLIGDAGFDTLYGNGGDDLLNGGGRTDQIVGGKGDDTMTGGGGGDIFVIRRVGNGDDEVTDFQNNADVVDISAFGVQNFNALKNSFNALSQTTDGVLVDLEAAGGSGSILLKGVTVADMDASDFIF